MKTTSRLKDYLAFSLVLAGLGVLVLSLLRSPPSGSSIPLDEAVDLQADPRDFLPAEALLPASGTAGSSTIALFVLHPKVCPPCLNEVSEFADLIQDLEPAQGVRPFILVLVEDGKRAERFLHTAGLKLPWWHCRPAVLEQRLRRPEEGESLPQQLVFLDPVRGRVFYRAFLPNVMTPMSYKRAVLKRMLEARGRLSS